MKIVVNASRLLVGALFIFSGIIKLNDPLGVSYKLQEYFSPEVLNMPYFEPYALIIAILIVVLEVVLGVFLLIGYKRKFTVWSLFAVIVFFTFLTFYAWFFDKVKDCGCFGDFLAMTPLESFIKDLVLLAFIIVLLFGINNIKPVFSKFVTTLVALLGFVISLWFGYHVLMHLPTWDFRAYKVGANITEGMTVPKDAPKAVQEFTWTFKINGENTEIVTNGAYPEVAGEYVSVESKVIEEGYHPPIYDFSIESEDEDLTTQFLREENLIIIVSYSLEKIERQGALRLKSLSDSALKKGYKVIGLTASGEEMKQHIKEAYNLNFDFYLCDEKALKTVVRANPGILELDKGTIKQKVHYNDIDDLVLRKVERKIEIKEKRIIAYFVDGKSSTKEEVALIDKSDIDSLNVVKDSIQLKELNTQNSTMYTEIIDVVLKKQ